MIKFNRGTYNLQINLPICCSAQGALIRVPNALGHCCFIEYDIQPRKEIYFVNEGTSEVRVPYSTEKRYETYAITPYLVVSGDNSTNMRRQSITVTEDDVLHGKVWEVTM
jgi:hypothetical protein